MYEIEQLSFSWGCPIAFQCSVHRIIFTSSLLNWSSSSDDFGLFSFNICFFQFQKTRQFGVMLPLYFPGYILQKAILGRNLHNIFPKNQRFGPSQNAGFVNDSAFKKAGFCLGSPVTSDLRSHDSEGIQPSILVTKIPHQRSRDSAIKVHQWDDGPLHCDCERQLWKQSATSAGERNQELALRGETAKNWGFQKDFCFCGPKKKMSNLQQWFFFVVGLFGDFFVGVGLSDLVQMKNYLKDLQWLWWNHTKIEGWIVYNARSVLIRIPMSFGL